MKAASLLRPLASKTLPRPLHTSPALAQQAAPVQVKRISDGFILLLFRILKASIAIGQRYTLVVKLAGQFLWPRTEGDAEDCSKDH